MSGRPTLEPPASPGRTAPVTDEDLISLTRLAHRCWRRSLGRPCQTARFERFAHLFNQCRDRGIRINFRELDHE